MSVSAALDALRQPEYTGENRCTPCTVVNAAIAVAVGALAWVVLAPAAGVVVLVVSATAIALRGYLVPGTPTLTKRYLPDRVLAYFDKAPDRVHATTQPDQPLDVEAILVSAGVVAPCADRDDLCLDPDFRKAWRTAIDDVSVEDSTSAAVATFLDVPEHELAHRDRGEGAFVATADGARVGQWESRAALLADAAAADLLAERDPDWDGRSMAARAELLSGLRLFLEACPDCGGPVDFGRETVESCCRSHEVVAVSCTDCGARLFEAEYDDPDTT